MVAEKSKRKRRRKPRNLNQLLDRLEKAADDPDEVTVGEIMDVVGRRSFGPILLVAGLITLAPLVGDIPGVPTIIAIAVLLTAIQIPFKRGSFWLPKFLLERSVAPEKLEKGVRLMRKPARVVDKLSKPRLTIFAGSGATYAIAGMCAAVALTMPIMETIPFSANLAGAAFTAFGLSLIARDGLLAIVAAAFTAGAIWFVSDVLIW